MLFQILWIEGLLLWRGIKTVTILYIFRTNQMTACFQLCCSLTITICIDLIYYRTTVSQPSLQEYISFLFEKKILLFSSSFSYWLLVLKEDWRSLSSGPRCEKKWHLLFRDAEDTGIGCAGGFLSLGCVFSSVVQARKDEGGGSGVLIIL